MIHLHVKIDWTQHVQRTTLAMQGMVTLKHNGLITGHMQVLSAMRDQTDKYTPRNVALAS